MYRITQLSRIVIKCNISCKNVSPKDYQHDEIRCTKHQLHQNHQYYNISTKGPGPSALRYKHEGSRSNGTQIQAPKAQVHHLHVTCFVIQNQVSTHQLLALQCMMFDNGLHPIPNSHLPIAGKNKNNNSTSFLLLLLLLLLSTYYSLLASSFLSCLLDKLT